MIIFGTRLFGETDRVPGLFHVTTRFFHIDFLPLVPIASYVVFETRRGGTTRSSGGIAIPVSGKSIMVAWIRAIACICLIGTFIAMMITKDESGLGSIAFLSSLTGFLTFCVVVPFVMWHKLTRNATYERAQEICSFFPPSARPALKRHIDVRFGKVAVEINPPHATVIVIDDDDVYDGDATATAIPMAMASPIDSHDGGEGVNGRRMVEIPELKKGSNESTVRKQTVGGDGSNEVDNRSNDDEASKTALLNSIV